jgi:hypothetical protein
MYVMHRTGVMLYECMARIQPSRLPDPSERESSGRLPAHSYATDFEVRPRRQFTAR